MNKSQFKPFYFRSRSINFWKVLEYNEVTEIYLVYSLTFNSGSIFRMHSNMDTQNKVKFYLL